MSEINTLPILAVDKNKGDYISSEKMAKYEWESWINDQEVPDRTNQFVRGCKTLQKNKRFFVPEEKRAGKYIE